MVSHSGWSGRAGTVDFCEIPLASAKRGKYRVDDGDHFMSKQRAQKKTVKTSKIQKPQKKPQFTYEFFFPFFPIPLNTYIKILPILLLHSTPAKKTAKIAHHHPQNGPQKAHLSYISLNW